MASRINPTEWKLLIGFMAFVDIGQLILDGFVIGLVTNRIIDLIIGFLLPVYFFFRGISIFTLKRAGAFFGTLGLEALVIGDGLPLWTLDVIYMYYSVKGESALTETTGVISTVRSFDRRIKRLPQNKDTVVQ